MPACERLSPAGLRRGLGALRADQAHWRRAKLLRSYVAITALLVLLVCTTACLPRRAPTLAWAGYDRALPPTLYAPAGVDLTGWSVTWLEHDGIASGCIIGARVDAGWQPLVGCTSVERAGSWGLAAPADERVQGAELLEESSLHLLGPPGTADPYGVDPTRLWVWRWALDLCGPEGATATRMVQTDREPRRKPLGRGADLASAGPSERALEARFTCGNHAWDIKKYGRVSAGFSVDQRIVILTGVDSEEPRLVELHRRARLVRVLPASHLDIASDQD